MSSAMMATGLHLDIRETFGINSFPQVGVEQQIQETERTLERLNRDLSLARTRALQKEQKLAEARHRMEQWRWVNAINEGDPEALRLAAVSLAAQTRVLDAAIKSKADDSARIERLQNRIERQISRYYDLQSRRRVVFGTRSRDNPAFPQPQTPGVEASLHSAPDDSSRNEAAADASTLSHRAAMNYSGYVFDRGGV